MTKDSVVLQRRKLDPAFHRCVFFFCASLILSARSPIPGARFACDRFEISRPSGTGPWSHLLLRSWKTSPTPPHPTSCVPRSTVQPVRPPPTPDYRSRLELKTGTQIQPNRGAWPSFPSARLTVLESFLLRCGEKPDKRKNPLLAGLPPCPVDPKTRGSTRQYRTKAGEQKPRPPTQVRAAGPADLTGQKAWPKGSRTVERTRADPTSRERRSGPGNVAARTSASIKSCPVVAVGASLTARPPPPPPPLLPAARRAEIISAALVPVFFLSFCLRPDNQKEEAGVV
jgi:hypothetical protein